VSGNELQAVDFRDEVLASVRASLDNLWSQFEPAEKAVLAILSEHGCCLSETSLGAELQGKAAYLTPLRRARRELGNAGFLVSREGEVRISPPLLGHWLQSRGLSSDEEIESIAPVSEMLLQEAMIYYVQGRFAEAEANAQLWQIETIGSGCLAPAWQVPSCSGEACACHPILGKSLPAQRDGTDKSALASLLVSGLSNWRTNRDAWHFTKG